MKMPESLTRRLARMALVLAVAPLPGAAQGERGGRSTPVPQELREASRFDPAQSAGLFVGISEFDPEEPLTPIPYAVDDAVDLAHLFVFELGLIPAKKATLSLAGEPRSPESSEFLEKLVDAGAVRAKAPSKSRLLKLLRSRSAQTGDDGLFVVSMATHGYKGHLVAADSLLSDITDTGVATSKLYEIVESAQTGRRIVLLDACREKLTSDSPPRGDPESAMSQQLADALAGAEGQVVLLGATSGGFSYDDDDTQNGVFSGAVIEGLRGAAPADPRGLITAETLAGFVHERVQAWVKENREHHAGKSRGIESRFSGDAATLPLAADPAGLERRRELVARRDAALERLRESFTSGSVISAEQFEKARELLSAEVLDATGAGLLEWVEKLDPSDEGSQRAMLQFLTTLAEPGETARAAERPAVGVTEAGEEPRGGSQEAQPTDLESRFAKDATIAPLPVVQLDLVRGEWRDIPAGKPFRFRFSLPFDEVEVFMARLVGFPDCRELFSDGVPVSASELVDTREADPGTQKPAEAPELTPLGRAAVRGDTDNETSFEIRVPALESPPYNYCLGFEAGRAPGVDELGRLRETLESFLDAELRKEKYRLPLYDGAEVATFSSRDEDYENLRRSLTAEVRSEFTGSGQWIRLSRGSFFDVEAKLAELDGSHREEFKAIAGVPPLGQSLGGSGGTTDKRSAAISRFEADFDAAVELLARIARIDLSPAPEVTITLQKLLGNEEDEMVAALRQELAPIGIDMATVLDASKGDRWNLPDLRKTWEPGEVVQWIKTLQVLGGAVAKLDDLVERAGHDRSVFEFDDELGNQAGANLVDQTVVSLEAAVEHLTRLNGHLKDRGVRITAWVERLVLELAQTEVRRIFVVSIP